MASFYDFTLTKPNGEEVKTADYVGKVVMVVNTATGCGFTPQYEPIEKMYLNYHDKGFEVIDVPCNQFGHQTPGTDEEIHEFCTLKYKTTFPQMKKSDVNGDNELPLYAYLKSQKGFDGFGKGMSAIALKAASSKMAEAKEADDIKWNFTKFIINRDGEVVRRFEPTTDMKEVEDFIVSLL